MYMCKDILRKIKARNHYVVFTAEPKLTKKISIKLSLPSP